MEYPSPWDVVALPSSKNFICLNNHQDGIFNSCGATVTRRKGLEERWKVKDDHHRGGFPGRESEQQVLYIFKVLVVSRFLLILRPYHIGMWTAVVACCY